MFLNFERNWKSKIEKGALSPAWEASTGEFKWRSSNGEFKRRTTLPSSNPTRGFNGEVPTHSSADEVSSEQCTLYTATSQQFLTVKASPNFSIRTTQYKRFGKQAKLPELCALFKRQAERRSDWSRGAFFWKFKRSQAASERQMVRRSVRRSPYWKHRRACLLTLRKVRFHLTHCFALLLTVRVFRTESLLAFAAPVEKHLQSPRWPSWFRTNSNLISILCSSHFFGLVSFVYPFRCLVSDFAISFTFRYLLAFRSHFVCDFARICDPVCIDRFVSGSFAALCVTANCSSPAHLPNSSFWPCNLLRTDSVVDSLWIAWNCC